MAKALKHQGHSHYKKAAKEYHGETAGKVTQGKGYDDGAAPVIGDSRVRESAGKGDRGTSPMGGMTN